VVIDEELLDIYLAEILSTDFDSEVIYNILLELALIIFDQGYVAGQQSLIGILEKLKQ